jgi:pimeloyl-ACP methyl ester carboxylesterase
MKRGRTTAYAIVPSAPGAMTRPREPRSPRARTASQPALSPAAYLRRVDHLRGLAVLALAAAAGAGAIAYAGTRPGALTAAHCPPALGAHWRCRTVTVAVDRTGRVPGHIALAVAEYHRPGPTREAVIAFAGGPGSAAVPKAQRYRALLAPLLRNRDLIVFDQRGTGVSGALRCPQLLGRSRFPAAVVRSCGARLGRRGAFFSSADSAADAEAVRRALGRPRVVLFGVSYGTKTATDYARRYPKPVRGMVLDSVVVADTDPLYRRSAVAAARILRDLCAETHCATDPVGDLETLVTRTRNGELTGHANGHTVRISESEILSTIVSSGERRRELPAALHAAVAGHYAALARLVPAEVPDLRSSPWLTAAFSATTYLATTCEDASFPWRATDGAAVRARKAAAWLARQRSADYAPFNSDVAGLYGSTRLCEPWPSSHERATLGPLPNVPALLLSGAVDALTPLEGAREVAAELPRSRLVIVPAADHVVLGTNGAAATALAAFARGL